MVGIPTLAPVPKSIFCTSQSPWDPQMLQISLTESLQGVKAKMPKNLDVDSIKMHLKQHFKLTYDPDDWQANLI